MPNIENTAELLARVKEMAPGFYTERDGSAWYIVAPNHNERIGEDFADRDDARRLLAWVAGGPKPEGWEVLPCRANAIGVYIKLPNTEAHATCWLRGTRKHFPRAAIFDELTSGPIEGARAGVIEALGGAHAKPT